MREIIFDTETTGFDPAGSDRITELGCIEVIDLIPTGREYHQLVNPERDIPKEVTELTGHTWDSLREQPKFAEIAEAFLAFVGDAVLVAHNAPFDRGFINMELERTGKKPIPDDRFKDTVPMARARFPGSPASLDALCKRFEISLESRTKHGALIDAYLLAEVYLELNGGREQKLEFSESSQGKGRASYPARSPRVEALASRLTQDEAASHQAYIKTLGDNSLWGQIQSD